MKRPAFRFLRQSAALGLAGFLLTLTTADSRAATLTNIAALGVATQTTSHGSGSYPASNAIDGNVATISHTDSAATGSAWILTFPSEQAVARIEIVSRAGCCDGRLNGSKLRLFNADNEEVDEIAVVDAGQGTTFVANLPSVTAVKSLRIGFEAGQAGIIHIAETRVIALVGELPQVHEFKVTPTNILAGQSATLSWAVANSTNVQVSGLGVVAPTGQVSVLPSVSTAYALTATDGIAVTNRTTAVRVDGQPLAPRISEFMARPQDPPDWIEIWNPDLVPVSLTGWHLTDNIALPLKWTFPVVTLQPGESIVVGAGAPFTTNGLFTPFNLAREANSFIALTDAGGAVVSSFTYPLQEVRASYGTDVTGNARYLLTPTPGELNWSATTLGFLPGTLFSVQRGFYDAPFSVVITPQTPGALVYYTTNGETPVIGAPASLLYTAPVAVNGTMVIRAAEFLPGYVPSFPEAHTYLFRSQVVLQPAQPVGWPTNWQPPGVSGALAPIPAPSDYQFDPDVVNAQPFTNMTGQQFFARDGLLDVPTICISLPRLEMFDPTNGLHANASLRGDDFERLVNFEIIQPNTNASYQCAAGLRIHGGRTRVREMLKKSFRVYFRGEYGTSKFEYPLFAGLPEGGADHLVLRGGTGQAWDSPWRGLSGTGNSLNRVTYLRDQFVRDLQGAMGQPSIKGNLSHLYINGLYWGLYNPVERPGGDWAANHFGGSETNYDVVRWAGQVRSAVSGDEVAWNELMGLSRTNVSLLATWAAVTNRLDVPNFIDHLVVNFYAGNTDWVGNNAYTYRQRSPAGGFKFLSWDCEEAFISLTQNSTGVNTADNFTELYQNLRNNLEFRVAFGDRAYKHLLRPGGVLTFPQTSARHDALAATIDRAIVGESARWGDSITNVPYTREAHWLYELQYLKTNYLANRPGITITQLVARTLYPNTKPPVFISQSGGQVSPGYQLLLDFPAGQVGTIYYTLDGSDPRAPGGAVSPTASVFTVGSGSPVTFPGDTTVRARILNVAEWSALEEASFVIGDPRLDLVISEIMYHPTNPSPFEFSSGYTNDDFFEFIEIRNVGNLVLSLVELQFTNGIPFNFAGGAISSIAPGSNGLVVANLGAFNMRYGAGKPVAGAWPANARLDNGGERLTLVYGLNGTNYAVRDFVYDDIAPWPTSPDGFGQSLVLVNPFARPDHANAFNWRASASPGGSPGTTDGTTFVGDPNADTDGDGAKALVEYATGTSDGVAGDISGVMTTVLLPNRQFEVTLRWNQRAEDLILNLETSTDLAVWSPVGGQFYLAAVNAETNGLARLVYRNALPVTEGKQFLRFSVSPR